LELCTCYWSEASYLTSIAMHYAVHENRDPLNYFMTETQGQVRQTCSTFEHTDMDRTSPQSQINLSLDSNQQVFKNSLSAKVRSYVEGAAS
jgi:hypothetical protein